MLNTIAQNLNYKWRLFGTAFSFFCFGLGSVILGLIVFPLIYLFKPIVEIKKITRYLIHKSFRIFIQMMRTMGVLDYRIDGDINLLNNQATLVLANHPTLLDVVFIISFMPNANCVVKKRLWDNWLTRAVVRGANYISNDSPITVIESCVDNLQKGESLIIFPEGTRSRHGELGKFKRGAAQIAIRSQASISTIIISCEPNTLSKQEKWHEIPPRKPLFCFKIRQADETLQNYTKTNYGDFSRSKAVRKFNVMLYDFFKLHLGLS